MKPVAVLVLAAALAAAAPGASAEASIKPWSGTPRLALSGRALDGHGVDLEALQGHVVLVNFWATWCEPCIAEMPSIERLRAKLGGQPFDVIAVNYGESRERITEFLQRQHVSLPVLLDPGQEAANAWNAKGLPMTFLVDADGRVRYWVFGEMDWDRGEGLKVVQQLVAEAPRAGH
jgi:thiol-disulfide isomerase/thioredoxin